MSTLTPVLSAVIAASAALLGVYLTQRQARLTIMMQRDEREESEWARRREEAAQAVGPVLSLLADADIATFVTSRQFKADPDEARRELSGTVLEQLLVIIDRWPALREKLLILATSHPSSRVHELTLALIDATSDLLARCYFYFGEFSRIDAVDPRVVPLASGLRLERAYDLERTPDEPADEQDKPAMRVYSAELVMLIRRKADSLAHDLLLAVRER
jgi:hypothetical protein